MRATVSLFRQDPARTALVRSVVTALAVGFLFRLVPDISTGLRRLDPDNLPGGFVPMYLLLTAFIVIMILSGNAWTRSSRLALGLPLSARRAWGVRITSLIAIAVGSSAALALTMGITGDLARGTIDLNTVIFLAAARAAATSILVLFLFQLPLAARVSIPITAPYVVYVVFVGTITIIFSSAALTSVAGTLTLLGVVLPLGVWLAVRVPPTFSIAPAEEESQSPLEITSEEIEPEDTAGWGPAHGERSGRSIHRVLFRSLKPNILVWLLLAIVGASTTVATLEFLDGTNAFVPLFFTIIYHLPLVQSALENLTPFDGLPVSRRVLWAHTVGPIAAIAGVAFVLACSIFLVSSTSYSQIHLSKGVVQVPWDYWRISPDGQVPSVVAPWNELFVPQAHTLWRGQTAALYNPFESGPDSSQRFLEFQIQRAARAVYGERLPEHDHSTHSGADQNAGEDDACCPDALREARGRLSGDRGRTAAVALMALALVITMILLPALLQYGPWVHRKILKWVSIGFVSLLVTTAVAASVFTLLGFTEAWYLGVLISICFRWAALALPLATPLVWLLCVTFWVGAYLLLERAFGMIEFPKEKSMNRFAEEY